MKFLASAARRPRRARAQPDSKPQGGKVAQGNSPSARPPRASKPRSSSPRKPTRQPAPAISLTPAQQEQIAAVTLILIGILTLLGGFNLSGGNILDGWTKILSVLFGWGRVLAPFFFGGLGAWLLLDSLDMRP